MYNKQTKNFTERDSFNFNKVISYVRSKLEQAGLKMKLLPVESEKYESSPGTKQPSKQN